MKRANSSPFSYKEREGRSVSAERLAEIQTEIEHTGTYRQTYDELVYGSMIGWRNHTRCVGRLYWNSLHVRDKRHLTNAHDVFEAIVEHLQHATNGGKILPMMTIFAPQEFRSCRHSYLEPSINSLCWVSSERW